MIIYPIVLIIAVGFANWAEFSDRIRCSTRLGPRPFAIGAFFVFLVLAGVSAFRWGVGTDYWTYEQLYEIYAREFISSLNILGEPGIRLFAWISMSTGASSIGMFALAAVVTVGLIVRSIWRWSVAFGFSIAVFILAGLWHGSFNGIRQYIAAAILLAGHRYIVNRQLLRWCLVVFVAILFHVSAIVGLAFYLVPRKKLSMLTHLTILLGAVFVLVGTGWILEFAEARTNGIGSWSGEYAAETVNPLRIAFRCLPWLLYWILITRKSFSSDSEWFYANMLIIVAATVIAGSSSAYLTRFALYPSLFLPISVALVTQLENRSERMFIRGFVLVVMALFMYFDISSVESLNHFNWIFEK